LTAPDLFEAALIIELKSSLPARFVPLLAGLITLTAYLLTLPPGLTWDLGGADGGELATAVYTLGLVHSPGYPSYLLLAQIARLVPFASFAQRLNAFSALCAAAAVFTLSAVAAGHLRAEPAEASGRPDGGTYLAGGLAGLLFGLCEVVWTQAIIVEVYALAALFCASLIGLALWIERAPAAGPYARRLVLFGLIAGIGMGSHYMMVFAGVFAALYLLLSGPRRLLRASSLLAIPAFAAGLSVFAYLPLRAGAVPLSNWGNPDTLSRFWGEISVAVYRGRVDITLIPERILPLVRSVVDQLSMPGTALALLGLIGWRREHKPLLTAALVTAALNLAFTASYYSVDTLPYIYPTLILLALAAGSAVHRMVFAWLPAEVHSGPALRGPAYAALTALVCAPLLVRGVPIVSQATIEADTTSRRIIESLPAGSLIISNEDRLTFALRYAAAVSVPRPDVVPIDARLLKFEWFRQDIARGWPHLGLSTEEVAPDDFEVARLLALIPPDVPVFFTYPAEIAPGYRLDSIEGGLLYRVVERPDSDS